MQSVRQIAVYHDDVNNKVVLVCPGDVDHRLQGHQHGNHCSQATGSFALNQEYRQPLCIRLTRVDEEQRILSAPPNPRLEANEGRPPSCTGLGAFSFPLAGQVMGGTQHGIATFCLRHCRAQRQRVGGVIALHHDFGRARSRLAI